MGKEVFIMGYMENYKKWCEDTYFDEATRAELKAIEGNDKEIQERFYKDLEFGDQGAECCCSRKPRYADCPPICRHSQNRRVCGALFLLYG